MRNYFYGINRSANTNLGSFENRSILLSDNNKLFRYGNLAILSTNRQSAVANQTVRFGAIDPRLTGEARMQAIQDRMNQVKAITGDNPNMKMTPEAWNLLAKGNAVQLDVQLNAPDRRNLAITGLVGLTQIVGGLSGASYNKEQGALLTGRAKEDADFVTKYGNKYDQGFFGIGAQYQDGEITVTDLGAPQMEMQREQIAADVQQAQQDTNMVVQVSQQKRNSDVNSVDTAPKYEGQLNAKNQRATNINGANGGSIEENAYQRLANQYLGNLSNNQLSQLGLTRNDVEKMSRGEALSRNKVDRLRQVGFSIGEDNGGERGVVTSILATQANLTSGGITGQIARAAASDYLKVAGAAGLLTADEMKLLNLSKSGMVGGVVLNDLLGRVESRINSGKYADGTSIGGDLTNFAKDRFIGGQHITELQYVANQRIKQNTDAAQQMNDVINGVQGATINASTVAIYNQANGLTGDKALTADQLKAQLASGNLTDVNNALNKIETNINTVRSALVGDKAVAKGLYGTRNDVLENTLESTDRVNGNDSDRTTGKDFFNEVADLRSLIAYRQGGGIGQTDTSTGKASSQTIAQQAQALNTDFQTGRVSQANQQEAMNSLISSFNNQLKANGITGYTDDQVSKVIQAKAGKVPVEGLSGQEKTLLDRLNNSKKALLQNFSAVSDLEKSRTTAPSPSSSGGTIVNGINLQDNVKGAAENLASVMGNKTLSNADTVKGLFNSQLSQELSKGNIKQADGTSFSQETIQRVAQAMSKGEVTSLTGAEKALYDQIKDNKDVSDKFSAVGTLFNKIDNNQQSSNISIGASNINNNIVNLGNRMTAANDFIGLTKEQIPQREAEIITSLKDKNILNSQGKNFDAKDLGAIRNVSLAIANGYTRTLTGNEKELYDKIKGTELEKKDFKELGGALNNQSMKSTDQIRNSGINIANQTTALSSGLDANNITKKDGSKYSREDIQAVAGYMSGATSSLTADQQLLRNEVNNKGLQQDFNNLGKEIKDSTGAGSLTYLDPYKGPTMKDLINGVGPERAKQLGISERASLKDRERYIDNGMSDPNDVKNKTNAQKTIANIADILNNRSFFNNNDSDTDDNRTIGEKITGDLIAIADQILSRIKNQNVYYYGFSQNATVSTSNYNNSDKPLSEMYNLALNAGIGVQQGVRQADKYTMRRDAEAETKGEKLTIEEAMNQFKEKKAKKDAEDSMRVAETNTVTSTST